MNGIAAEHLFIVVTTDNGGKRFGSVAYYGTILGARKGTGLQRSQEEVVLDVLIVLNV